MSARARERKREAEVIVEDDIVRILVCLIQGHYNDIEAEVQNEGWKI